MTEPAVPAAPGVPLVFLDCESTGLSRDAHVWEVAAIRRDTAGDHDPFTAMVAHDPALCAQLPASFLADHRARWNPEVPCDGAGLAAGWGMTPAEAWAVLLDVVAPTDAGKAHLVGAVPWSDTEWLLRMGERAGVRHPDDELPWHHHLIDVESMAVGALAATGGTTPLPWWSDEVTAAVGAALPADEDRHTALGDTRWALSTYDAVLALADR